MNESDILRLNVAHYKKLYDVYIERKLLITQVLERSFNKTNLDEAMKRNSLKVDLIELEDKIEITNIYHRKYVELDAQYRKVMEAEDADIAANFNDLVRRVFDIPQAVIDKFDERMKNMYHTILFSIGKEDKLPYSEKVVTFDLMKTLIKQA